MTFCNTYNTYNNIYIVLKCHISKRCTIITPTVWKYSRKKNATTMARG